MLFISDVQQPVGTQTMLISIVCVDAAEEEDSLKQAPRAADQPREDSNIWVSALAHVGRVPKLLNCTHAW